MAGSSLRIGVLTGGGDCPGLNAVIRAVTKSLILKHNAEVVGIKDGFRGLIEHDVTALDFRDVSGILTEGGTILGASNKANPFDYYRRGGADCSADAIRTYRDLGLDGMVAIGGDGTMSIAHRLQEMGLNLVGVPKTIDNDVVGTDRTFGFDTAVSIVTEAIDRIHTTAQSHHRVMIVETMGRYAGWIALHAGVAGGADVILIPELEYELDEIVQVCRERENGGQRFTIIAVAEGAKPKGGERAVDKIVEDSPDPVRLGGIGHVLEHQLQDKVSSEVRTTILGHMQRGGTPTAFDRNLSTIYGAYAATLVAEGTFGQMVAIDDGHLSSVDLGAVAGKTRTVPLTASLLVSGFGLGTSFGVSDLNERLGPLDGAAVVA
jgi:6-phosphofructokinase 1